MSFRFLIIEDDVNLTKIWQEFLSPLGCVVDVAHTLTDAERQMRIDPRPDVLFLDLRLPDSPNDEETLAKIRFFKEIHPFARVIVATGYASERIHKLALELGADDFQEKLNLDSQEGLWCVVKSLLEKNIKGTRESVEKQLEIQELLSKLIPPNVC